MGWDGYYRSTCPKGKERLEEAMRGYNWENEHAIARVLDSALVGTDVYAAIELTTKATGERKVRAAIILTKYDRRDGCFMMKHMSEDVGPTHCKCPKRILDLLTPTDNEWANQWREICRMNLTRDRMKKNLSAGKLPLGTMIRLKNPQRTILTTYKDHRTGRNVFFGAGVKASVNCVNSWGYEVIKEGE